MYNKSFEYRVASAIAESGMKGELAIQYAQLCMVFIDVWCQYYKLHQVEACGIAFKNPGFATAYGAAMKVKDMMQAVEEEMRKQQLKLPTSEGKEVDLN